MSRSSWQSSSLTGILAGTATIAAIVITQPAMAKTAREVAQIAIPTTVRIDNALGNDYGGSGVIIARRGKTYTVLTANHVVSNNSTEYSIYTSRKKSHPVQSVISLQRSESDPDLAIVIFESSDEYPVAPISDSDEATIGSGVYISGYPQSIENNGEREYEFTAGQVTSRPERRANGYTLRYDAVTRRGMSGGPVFDVSGRVVGIHGQGDRVGVVQEASGGTEDIKTGWNAAVPINLFRASSRSAGVEVASLKIDDKPPDNVEAVTPPKEEVQGWFDNFALGLGIGIIQQVVPRFPGIRF